MALLKLNDAQELTGRAIVLDLGDLRRQGDRLIEAAEQEAARLIQEARMERARILTGAAETGHAEGLAKGLQEGRDRGAQEGAAAAIAQTNDVLDKLVSGWSAALDDFETRRDRMVAEGQCDVVRLAALIASKVIKRSIELDQNVVVAQMADVLSAVLRPTRLLVLVHPEDRPILQQALPALLTKVHHATHVDLTDDPTLPRGSCSARLAEGGGAIDASIDVQLQRIVDALLPPIVGPTPPDLRTGS